MKKILLIILLLIVGCGGTDKTPKETKVTSQKRTSSKKKIVKSNQNKIDYDKWLEISKEFPKEFPSREQVFSDQNPLDEKTLIDSEGIMNVPIDKEPFIEPYTGMVSIFDEYGEKKKIKEGNYKNGVKHGKWVKYDPSGSYNQVELNIENYKNGIKHGNQLYWEKDRSNSSNPHSVLTWKRIEVWEDGERVLGMRREENNGYDRVGNPFGKSWLTEGSFVGHSKQHNYYKSIFVRFGEWKFWSPNGKDSCEVIYKNFDEDDGGAMGYPEVLVLSGNKIVWHENSVRAYVNKTSKDGKLYGITTYWDINGQKVSELTYEDGKMVFFTHFDAESGKKEKEGEIHSDTYDFDEPVGKWTYWYENGQKEKEGEYYGEFVERDLGSRTPQYIITSHTKKGKWTYWYENGQKEKEGIHGKEWAGQESYQGEWTYWYENGQKKKLANHVGFYQVVGLYTEWWSNGQKKVEGNWVKDENIAGAEYGKNGLWTEWDESGNVVKETAYKSGDVLWTKP